MIQFSALSYNGPDWLTEFGLAKHNKQYTGMHSFAPWQTQQDCINISVNGAPCGKQGSRERPPWFQAKRNRNALPSFRNSDGDVPCWGTGLHHHANRQMVEWRIFVIHLHTGQAILATRCGADAHVPFISSNTGHRTLPGVKQRPPTVQPSRQRWDKAKYWMQCI